MARRRRGGQAAENWTRFEGVIRSGAARNRACSRIYAPEAALTTKSTGTCARVACRAVVEIDNSAMSAAGATPGGALSRLTRVKQGEPEAGGAMICRDCIPPSVRRLGSEDPQRRPRDEMALKVEVIVDSSMNAE